MTNWVSNRMQVSGQAELLADFVKTCLCDGYGIDPDALIPMPPILREALQSSGATMGDDAELGIEVLTRAPFKPRYGASRSVLGTVAATKAGIRTYDDLENWVKRKRPQAIAAGTKCLRAHKEMGFWFARDWQGVNWGAWCVSEFAISDQSPNSLEATFLTPWSTIDGIFPVMASRYPALNIRVAACEPGNEFAYVFSSSDGKVSVEEPEFTDAFVAQFPDLREIESEEVVQSAPQHTQPDATSANVLSFWQRLLRKLG
jgi:hypothetical protein